MFDLAMIDNNQFDMYAQSIKPISMYVSSHKMTAPSDYEAQKLLPYAKQTQFVTNTLIDIIDDLKYDKEKFEHFVAKLDDDYDLLEEFVATLNPRIKSHHELMEISKQILDDLAKAQMDLGIIISHHENKSS
ncbi:hypothetical protein MNB_SM-7-1151 [hydrothermal vent metagenome]|uniref:Uncharacterized protein n=1 Tax=hydrothermal vent metagenome TaxID=652676 RepID=A0A1W1BAT4_9ZZZZ